MKPIDAARELVEVLEQLESLQTRRVELVTELANMQLPYMHEITKPLKAPKGPKGVEHATLEATAPYEAKEALTPIAGSRRTDEQILADPHHRTEAEKERVAELAADIYDANVDPATEPQKRMIFGILSKQFGIKDDAEKKQLIIAILEKQKGIKLESISKELSKAWAGDLIDYLESATNAEIEAMRVPF